MRLTKRVNHRMLKMERAYSNNDQFLGRWPILFFQKFDGLSGQGFSPETVGQWSGMNPVFQEILPDGGKSSSSRCTSKFEWITRFRLNCIRWLQNRMPTSRDFGWLGNAHPVEHVKKWLADPDFLFEAMTHNFSTASPISRDWWVWRRRFHRWPPWSVSYTHLRAHETDS